MAGRQDITQLNDEMAKFTDQDQQYNSAYDNTWLTRYKAGSGLLDDPFYLSEDSFTKVPEENRTPVPIHVPAYPGRNYTCKGRQGQCA